MIPILISEKYNCLENNFLSSITKVFPKYT
jgi:hypothetical protein